MLHRYGRSGLALFATALYGGPVIAGLAGHPWSVVPVFAMLFLFYVAATRKPDLSTGAGWAGLAIMASMQVAIALFAFAAGLMATTLVAAISLPLWAPFALTAAAAGLGAWAYRDAAEMDVMLDDTLRALEDMNKPAQSAEPEAWPDHSAEAAIATEAALAALRGVPLGDTATIDGILDALEAEASADAFDPLYDAAGHDSGTDAATTDIALIRFARRPKIHNQLLPRGEAGLAATLLLNASDPAVRAATRDHVRWLTTQGATTADLPDPIWLRELASEFPHENYDDLADQLAAL